MTLTLEGARVLSFVLLSMIFFISEELEAVEIEDSLPLRSGKCGKRKLRDGSISRLATENELQGVNHRTAQSVDPKLQTKKKRKGPETRRNNQKAYDKSNSDGFSGDQNTWLCNSCGGKSESRTKSSLY